MKSKTAIILASLLLGIVIWVLDAIVDKLFFYDESFFDALFWGATSHELYFRILNLFICLIFGVFFSKAYERRIRTENNLLASENKFSKVFGKSELMMAISTIKDGLILDVNNSFLRNLGFERNEVLGKTSLELGLIEKDRLDEFIRNIEQNGFVRDFDVILHTKSGDVLQAIFSAEEIEVDKQKLLLVMILDVTEYRRTKEALSEYEARLQSVFRSAPSGVALAIDRILMWTNEKISEITGYSADDLQNRSVRMLYPNDAEYQYVGKVLYSQIRDFGTGTAESKWRRKDGGLIDVLIIATNVDANDYSRGIVFTALDITKRKKAEREREALIAELGEKNAELERFTYTVSHDLKSPLITIKGYIGRLRKHFAKGVEQEDIANDIDRIDNAAGKMQELLENLLELSRIGRVANPMTRLRLNDVVNSSVRQLKGIIRQRGVHVEIAPDLPEVIGDESRLSEVFQNLIENAVKFMGEQPAPKVEIGWRQEGYQKIVFVKDNGIGLESRYAEKIFGLFEQLNPKINGTGIGLAVVKRIIEVHGGRVWVESAGNSSGCCFCIMLPVPRHEIEN